MTVATLLVVAHLPADSIERLHQAVLDGAQDPAIEGVEVVSRPALDAGVDDVLAADGVILGTTVNFGYISGGLKDFFDRTYPTVKDERPRLPFASFLKGNTDATGALKALQQITTGLKWKQICEPLVVLGDVEDKHLEQAYELGGTVAAHLMMS